MVPIIGILASALLIAMIEIPNLLKKNLKREFWLFSILLLIGTVGSILKSLNVNLPNPFDFLTAVYKPFSDFLFGFLE